MTQSQKSDRVHSVSRSGCEVQSHHRGLMKTSNFRREIRKTYYRNDPVKYDLDFYTQEDSIPTMLFSNPTSEIENIFDGLLY